jgi:hypothetical protein
VRAHEERPEQLGLAEVVLIELGPHSLECILELGLEPVTRAQALRDPDAFRKACADRIVVSHQEHAGGLRLHASPSTQTTRHVEAARLAARSGARRKTCRVYGAATAVSLARRPQ